MLYSKKKIKIKNTGESTVPQKKKECITTKYMSNFQCLMGDCPNTCCKGWRVQVAKPEYKKLKKRYSKSKETREIFRTFINRNKDPETKDLMYAELAMSGKDNHCTFFNSDGACQIHADYGIDYLPSVCEIFPRSFSLFDDKTELYGDLACPEVARLCLLDEKAFELEIFPQQKMPQRKFYAHYVYHESDGYHLYFNDLKHFVMDFLKHDEISFEERCFYLANLAVSTSEIYKRGCGKEVLPELQKKIADFQTEESLRKAKAIYDSCPEHNPEALMTLLSVARTAQSLGVQRKQTDGFEDMMDISFQSLFKAVPLLKESLTTDCDISAECYQTLMAHYLTLSQSNNPAVERRLNLYLKNFSLNYWAKRSFTKEENLSIYVTQWIMTMVLLKVLLFTHPDWEQVLILIKDQSKQNECLEFMDKLVVEVVYKFSRGVEHKDKFIQKLSEYIGEINEHSLVKAALFLKI